MQCCQIGVEEMVLPIAVAAAHGSMQVQFTIQSSGHGTQQ
jgi:hypothetical protein